MTSTPETPDDPSVAQPDEQIRDAAPASTPQIEAPSPDVTLAAEASALPGAHRGGYSRLPTAPVAVTSESAPAEPGTEPVAQWMFTPPARSRGFSAWALGFAIVGLVVSFFVGWGLALGIVAIVTAIMALRRPLESRGVAIWALVLGIVSLAYSALWLWWAASRANLFG